VLFAQQLCPWPPQLADPQVPLWQVAPVWQLAPAQQGWPTAPHAAQVFVLGVQTLPGWQEAPVKQQTCPTPPHGPQVPPALQVSPWRQPTPQQGWPASPQATQRPVLGLQIALKPNWPHAPSQQGWPALPQR
jgi:hypothetical protein